MDNVFFTSDTHFYHGNIIRYCDRPFLSVDDMNESLVNNWNCVVGPDDMVYHLGDVAFASQENTLKTLERLNGKITLVLGNHDRSAGFYRRIKNNIVAVTKSMTLNLGGKDVLLEHIPRLVEPDVLQLCGHVHTAWKTFQRKINVGVDVWDFKPVPSQVIVDLIGKT